MQGILGTSKNNPLFFINHHIDTNQIDIFLGFEKIATIPNEKDSLLFRSVIYILISAGIRYIDITNNLNISFKTIKKSIEIFSNSSDDENLKISFRSPGRSIYKMNDGIFQYIHERAEYYRGIGKKNFLKKIQKDLKNKFNIDFSREKLRTELKKNIETKPIIAAPEKKEQNSLFKVESISADYKLDTGEKISEINPIVFRNQYAGLLLHNHYLGMVLNDLPTTSVQNGSYNLKAILTWWMYAILSGAKNIEQQKYLNKEDFEFITGYKGFPNIVTMRNILKELSLTENTKVSTIILKNNIDYFSVKDNNFYIDGHSEEYTGKGKILEIWHTVKNRALKGIIDYFIHDGHGNPLFSMLLDGFYDFREVIRMILGKLKEMKFPKPWNIIYDRGAFSKELMQEISSVEGQYFISWQKGFKKEEADNVNLEKSMFIEYPYNDVGKIKNYKIFYGEDVWEKKDFSCRRIIICKDKDEKGKKFLQSILTNEVKSDATEIILKIVRGRPWQENDFKKEKNHFGLDEITSYKKIEYGKLEDKDKTKKVNSKIYKQILSEIRKLKIERNKILAGIGLKILCKVEVLNASLIKKLAKKLLDKKKIDQIKKINKKIQKKIEIKNNTEKNIFKLQQCSDEARVELDLRIKRLFNVIKLTCRNVSEKGAKDFLEIYRNLRDYQNTFRILTRTAGEIKIENNMMHIKLDKFGRQSFQKKGQLYMDQINNLQIRMLDGKYILHFSFSN